VRVAPHATHQTTPDLNQVRFTGLIHFSSGGRALTWSCRRPDADAASRVSRETEVSDPVCLVLGILRRDLFEKLNLKN
jgi:hypothetical protein